MLNTECISFPLSTFLLFVLLVPFLVPLPFISLIQARYSSVFKDQNIDGKALALLSLQSLPALGMEKVAENIKFMALISKEMMPK